MPDVIDPADNLPTGRTKINAAFSEVRGDIAGKADIGHTHAIEDILLLSDALAEIGQYNALSKLLDVVITSAPAAGTLFLFDAGWKPATGLTYTGGTLTVTGSVSSTSVVTTQLAITGGTLGTPADTSTPTEFVQVTVNGNTRYIPLYAL